MRKGLGWVLAGWAAVCGAGAWAQEGAAGFSIRAALSAPYGLGLTAAPVGERFAWVENAEGVHNVWVGGPGEQARMLTRYHEDDGQDVEGLAWAPDGEALAYVLGAETGQAGAPANPAELQRDTERQLWVVKVGSGETVQVAGGGAAPLFAKDGKRLLFTRKGKIFSVGLGEEARGGRDGRGGEVGGAAQLVWDRGMAGGMVLSPDGRWLAYVSRRKDHSFIGLFDMEAKVLRWVAPGTGIDSAPVFSRDGKTLYWLRRPYIELREFVPQRTEPVSWQVMAAEVAAPEAGREVWAPKAGERGSGWPHVAVGEPYLMVGAGGEVLFFAETDGWLHVYSSSGKEGGARLLTPGAFEVEDARVSPDGKTLWWASNDASADRLDVDRRHVWREDLRAGAKAERVTRGAGIETRPVVGGDGKVAGAMVADAHVPMHAVLLGADGGMREMRPGAWPEGYPGKEFVTPEQAVFRAKAGGGGSARDAVMEIHGQVFVPRGEAGAVRKRPALVFFHGGPHRQMLLGYPAMEYYSQAYAMNEYLAAQGYVVLSVNYRCGVGYGMEFRECERAGAAGASEYNDALGAVEYLRGRGDVDMGRVGIWGGSYGGYFTALGLARNSDLFRAGVDFHGVHDWALEDNAPHDWLKGTNAEVDAIAARAREASPVADVGKWRSPVLLIHGDDDANVTYVQTAMLAEKLKEGGVHVEELVFPDEIHEFLLHRDWLRAYEAMAEFFGRELK